MPLTKAEQFTRKMPRIESSQNFLAKESAPTPVTREWVITSFLENTVRLGTGAEDRERRFPPRRSLPTRILSASEKHELLQCFRTLAPIEPSSQRYANLAQQYDLPAKFTRTAQALSVLCNPFFRAGSYETMGAAYIRQLYSQLASTVHSDEELRIVLPTLPFKDQCAVTTAQPVGTVDIGEHLLLFRMDLLASSLQRIGVPAKITLVTDGTVYADIFTRSQTEAVKQYYQRCQDIQKAFSLQSVELEDMQNIVTLEPRFQSTHREIRLILEAELQRGNSEISREWSILERGMLFNCELPMPFNTYESFTELMLHDFLSIQFRFPNVKAIIERATLEYSSFLLTMRKLNILQRRFSRQGDIRATVHPKQGQLGLHTLGSSVAPYNGVVVLSQEHRNSNNRNSFTAVKCDRYWKIFESFLPVTRVVEENGTTFFYEQYGTR